MGNKSKHEKNARNLVYLKKMGLSPRRGRKKTPEGNAQKEFSTLVTNYSPSNDNTISGVIFYLMFKYTEDEFSLATY